MNRKCHGGSGLVVVVRMVSLFEREVQFTIVLENQ